MAVAYAKYLMWWWQPLYCSKGGETVPCAVWRSVPLRPRKLFGHPVRTAPAHAVGDVHLLSRPPPPFPKHSNTCPRVPSGGRELRHLRGEHDGQGQHHPHVGEG